MRRSLIVSPVILAALVSACAADVSSESVADESSAIICSVHTPPGTPCTNPPPPNLPVVEYETVAVSDVSATVGFLTPRGLTATAVTVNFPSVTPATPTTGLVVASDAPSTSHALSLNGLVANTAYRYDIWVGSTRQYTGYFTTTAPVALALFPRGAHDATINPVVTQYATAAVTSSAMVGFIVGVRRGNVQELYSFGTTDLTQGPTTYNGTSIPITGALPNSLSVFGIGSISKTFTATLLARFATDPTLAGSHVGLSDSVMSYLPAANQVPGGWQNQITLFELGHYTSGLPRDETTGLGSVSQLFSYVDNVAQAYPPGTSTAYSNLAFNLLGRALEHKLDTSWEDLVQQNIATPLAMSDTKTLVGGAANCGGVSPCEYRISVAEQSRLAQGYGCTTLPCVPGGIPAPTGANVDNPAGGLLSTGSDMLKWLGANMGHTSAAWMGAVVPTVRTLPSIGTGLGWGVTTLDSATAGTTTLIEKSGLLPGSFQAYIGYLPQLDVGAFVMANSSELDTGGLVQNILANLPASSLVNLPAY